MMTLSLLSESRWFGSVLLAASALSLPLMAPDSELFWLVAVLGLTLAITGMSVPSRWLVSIPTLFTASLSAFYLRSLPWPGSAASIILMTLLAIGITLWLMAANQPTGWLLAYAVGITLLEVFLILTFWPINFPSRALIVTAIGFLTFEYIDRHNHGLGFTSILGTVGIVFVAIATVIATSNWESF